VSGWRARPPSSTQDKSTFGRHGDIPRDSESQRIPLLPRTARWYASLGRASAYSSKRLRRLDRRRPVTLERASPGEAIFRVTSRRTLRITSVTKQTEFGVYERSRQRDYNHNVSASSPLARAGRSLGNGGMASILRIPKQETKQNVGKVETSLLPLWVCRLEFSPLVNAVVRAEDGG